MRNLIFLLLVFLSYGELYCQKKYTELTWQRLSDVEFEDVFLEEFQAHYCKPTFSPEVISAEGDNFYITGYVIPIDIDEDFYVLSRYPSRDCYLPNGLCGKAGTAVDLQFPNKAPREYVTDERLTFAGTLKLNADDIYQMSYILKDAVEYPNKVSVIPSNNNLKTP